MLNKRSKIAKNLVKTMASLVTLATFNRERILVVQLTVDLPPVFVNITYQLSINCCLSLFVMDGEGEVRFISSFVVIVVGFNC